MCLYPKLIQNPKYKETKKNGGIIPPIKDKRVMAVPIGCGRCAECLKKKANEWRVRLLEEVKHQKLKGHFVTLTFSEKSLQDLQKELKDIKGYELENQTATLAVRRFLERWRKKHKRSVRHWLITELGHENTERIHLHGIIWTDKPKTEIQKHWQYGHVWAGYKNQNTYVNERTVNYIIKYVTKTDQDHRYYIPKILTSKGIGKGWTKTLNTVAAQYKGDQTKEYYRTKTGHKIGLPIYYRNKIYTEEERENLWLNKLDQQVRYVDGIKIDISKNQENYIHIRNLAREKYEKLGYNGEYNWEEEKYEHERRVLLQEETQRTKRLVSTSSQTSCSFGALHLENEKANKTGEIPRSKEFD